MEAFQDSEAPDVYPWSFEEDRWEELVFCLLTRIGQPELSAETARRASMTLRTLGLLDVALLANAASTNGEPDYEGQHLSKVMGVLQQLGFDIDASKTACASITDVARSLVENRDGKVQGYLRHYGQLMIDELLENFSFSRLGEQDARYAFTHWLQNVLNMPLATSDPSVEMLCRRFDVEVEDLLAAIEDRDLNLALVDEIAVELLPIVEEGTAAQK